MSSCLRYYCKQDDNYAPRLRAVVHEMKIKIAKGLAEILDQPVDHWGSIREAITAHVDMFPASAIEFHDDEFDALFGHCIDFKVAVEEDLPDDFCIKCSEVAEALSMNESQAATYMVDLVRTWIRTAGHLSHEY